MGYYVGDIPSVDLVLEPAQNGDPLDLTPFVEADTIAELYDFDGILVTADFTPTFLADELVLEWPSTSTFAEAGLYELRVTLVGPDHRVRLAPVHLVAQDEASGWHTLDTAIAEWPSASSIADPKLWSLLELARQQVVEYAPVLAADTTVPPNYRQAQLAQARNLLNAILADPSSGGQTEEDFVLRAYPVDWMVKQILRPKRGVKVVG